MTIDLCIVYMIYRDTRNSGDDCALNKLQIPKQGIFFRIYHISNVFCTLYTEIYIKYVYNTLMELTKISYTIQFHPKPQQARDNTGIPVSYYVKKNSIGAYDAGGFLDIYCAI